MIGFNCKNEQSIKEDKKRNIRKDKYRVTIYKVEPNKKYRM